MKRIMIIEDEPALRDELSVLLQNAGYEPIAVTDYDNVSEQMKVADADLILLDINLPNVNGETLLQDFRKEHDTPVIMLTSRTTEIDEVLSMSYGADDYITKPFNPVEVLARVKSQLRRFLQLGAAVKAPSELTVGGICLDHDAKRVTLDGEPIALTPKEYDILYYLMQHPGKVFTPAELYSAVWNEAPVGIDNTVAVHIRHLREKLEIDPSNPRYLKVVWGKGYKLEGDRQ